MKHLLTNQRRIGNPVLVNFPCFKLLPLYPSSQKIMYCESLTAYKRLKTREVKVGNLLLGNGHPIRVQTMTTTDTMDTMATVEQSIRCIEAGS